MKKIALLIIIVVCIVGTTFGCKTEDKQSPNTEDVIAVQNQENTSTSKTEKTPLPKEADSTENTNVASTPSATVENTFENQETEGIVDEPSVETPIITIKSIEDYNEFLKNIAKTYNIVSYDSIKAYGNFKMFKVLSDGNNGDYSQYCYTFDDGATLYITDTNVRPPKENQEQTINEQIVNLNDMRTIETSESGMYYLGDLGYYYVSGKLLFIKWNNDNLEYKICGDSLLADYPYGKQTKIAELLMPKTAE